MPKFKCDILIIFQTMCVGSFHSSLTVSFKFRISDELWSKINGAKFGKRLNKSRIRPNSVREISKEFLLATPATPFIVDADRCASFVFSYLCCL